MRLKFLTILLILIALLSAFWYIKRDQTPEITLVLSPHFDDAVLSLGGLLSREGDKAIVASFFTDRPTGISTTLTPWDALSGFSTSTNSFEVRQIENTNALRVLKNHLIDLTFVDYQYRGTTTPSDVIVKQLVKDIKILIGTSTAIRVNVYGPATFGPTITHPDHELLHEAFVQVAKEYLHVPNRNFYMYEDFPYIADFNAATSTSFQSFVAAQDTLKLSKHPLYISSGNLDNKIISLSKYTSQVLAFKNLHKDLEADVKNYTAHRCWYSCEMVYVLK